MINGYHTQMEGVPRVLLLLFYFTIFDGSGVLAQIAPISSCTSAPAAVNPPAAVSDLAGIWYIYAASSASLPPILRCGVCQVTAAGATRCVIEVSTGTNTFQNNYYTGTITGTNGAFTFTGTNGEPNRALSFTFRVTQWDAATCSMVVTICYGPIGLFNPTYMHMQIGLTKGADTSALTAIPTASKVNVEHQTACKTYDFSTTSPATGKTEGPVTSTTARPATTFGGAFGDTCAENCQCRNTNQQCISNKCACSTGFCDDGNKNCNKATGVNYDAACDVSCQCTGTGSPNTECTGTPKKCKCKSGFCFASSECRATTDLGGTCVDNCQCTGSNQECTGSPKKCTCASGYCDDGNKACKQTGKNLGDACDANCQCTGTANMECKNSKCTCKATFCKVGSTCVSPFPDYVDRGDGVCMRYENTHKAYDAAKADCENDATGKTRLVSIPDAAKNTLVKDFIDGRGTAYIGLKQQSTPTAYDWANGNTINRPLGANQYDNWYDKWGHDNDGNNDGTGGTDKDGNDCVIMYDNNGKWADTLCTGPWPFVCETY